MGSDKSGVDCDVGLGLRMHQMSGMPNRQDQQPQLSSSSGGGGVGGLTDLFGQGNGQMRNNNGMEHFSFDSAVKNQEPIRGPFSFTKAQWQELERQTVVYKFLSASIPVPPQLLMPINGTQTNSVASHPTKILNFGFTASGLNQEPWRCRRTDGKKWRCSRDVAPDMKYCERHAHKNRPRSRKHVELPNPNLGPASNLTTVSKKNNLLDLKASSKSVEPRCQSFSLTEPQLSPYPTLASYNQQRCSLDWFPKADTTKVSSSNQQWRQITQQPKEGLTGAHNDNFFKDANIFKQPQETRMISSGLGVTLGSDSNNQNNPCGLLRSTKLAFLNDNMNDIEETERPRGFIDAWSTTDRGDSISEIGHKYSDPMNVTVPVSSLTLSMSGGNGACAEDRPEQLCVGLMDTEHDNNGLKLQQLPMVNWMSTGGPLAEALCLGFSSQMKSPSTHQPTSPYGCSSNTGNTKQQSSSGESSQGFD